MPHNEKLKWAKRLKRDSLYTQSTYIERKMKFYEEHFKGKTVLCNCDDDEYSEFFKYFYQRFDVLGLKKLIGVHYESKKYKPSYKVELYKDTNKDGIVNFKDKIIKTPIYGDDEYPAGDFRSPECIDLLKKADIVVTNPPFSLLREYVAQLVEYDKKFIIIGNTNAIGYKEIFPLFKENKILLGVTTRPDFHKDLRSTSMWFRVPDSYELENSSSCKIDENGKKYVLITNARWFTNLKTGYRQKTLDMRGVYYTPEKYPKYDNYDAINVDKVADIPCDYPGIMGVPLTFMDKYCPEQFEIVGLAKRGGDPRLKTKNYTKDEYDNYSDLNAGPTILKDSLPKVIYSRILIKNKHPENSKQRDQLSQRIVLPEAFVAEIASNVAKKAA